MSVHAHQLLTIDGAVDSPLSLTFAELVATTPLHDDLSHIGARWPFGGLPLQTVTDCAIPSGAVDRVRLEASQDGFHRTVSWEALREVAWLVFCDENRQPLSAEQGGPVRLWISEHSACGLSELDACANIKHLDRLSFLLPNGD
jgi:hypothetical protein